MQARSSRQPFSASQGFCPQSASVATARRARAMTEGFDSAGPDAVAPDSSPAPEVTVGEVARLTQYAGTQERKINELEITVGHLRHALQARIVIDRAIGLLAERFDLSIADAFELLRAAARDSRR